MLEISNETFVSGLRKLADLYEAHPEVPLPHNIGMYGDAIYCHSPAGFAAAVRMFGAGSKSDGDSTLDFTPGFPLPFKVYGFKSDICERVQIGEEVVPAQPEQVVPEHVIPAVAEHTKPIYKWNCKPFLGGGAEDK